MCRHAAAADSPTTHAVLAAGAVMEVQVPDHNFNVASAFNDTSLHVFRPAQLADLGP